MILRRLTIAIVLVSGLAGCGGRSPIAPGSSDLPSTGPASETFLIRSSLDARLPPAGLEASAATAADQARFGKLVSARLPRASVEAVHPIVYWNRLTAELGLASRLPPPMFARDYALVQIGIFDALVASGDHRRGLLAERAVAAGVASQVLSYLFPNDVGRIDAAVAEQLALAGGTPGQALGGWSLGRAVGKLVVEHGRSDGSDAPFTGSIPTGDGIWTGTNPVLPMCGSWKTWILSSLAEPEPPYRYGSFEDLRDVQEVYEISLHRTPEQIAIVHKWADRSPPTIWNGLLNDRIESLGLDVITAARAHAHLNAAMLDAFICCWKTKYVYWVARPFQRIAGLVTVIPTPNFPSYTSGHSTISAAAAEVMGEVFPAERDFFQAEALEAADSRLWGGIHFRHDDDAGTVIGRGIGEQVVERMRSGRSFQWAGRP